MGEVVLNACWTPAGTPKFLSLIFKELSYYERKAIHNLKYYTWVEQQGRTSEELNAQWSPEFWQRMFEEEVVVFDRTIAEFNALVARG